MTIASRRAPAASRPDGGLERFRWSARLLLVFAPAPDDPALVAQRTELAAATDLLRERDLRVIEIVGNSPEARADGLDGRALRAAWRAPLPHFAAILVGKDGGEKLRSAQPIAPHRLVSVIDAMPMRRREAAGR